MKSKSLTAVQALEDAMASTTIEPKDLKEGDLVQLQSIVIDGIPAFDYPIGSTSTTKHFENGTFGVVVFNPDRLTASWYGIYQVVLVWDKMYLINEIYLNKVG
jgi:hypothetical protein